MPSAELLYLFIALAAGAATFWYAGRQIGIDLSSITAAADFLGIRQFALRYDARAPAPVESAQESAGAATQASAPVATAAVCSPSQPIFVLGMADLKQQLGDVMGVPLECEHPAGTAGDSVQQTSTGLAVYSKGTNSVTFTDGWRHWALDATGDLISWEGTQADPPRG
ncbi:MAG TPA: hypothetical protein VFG86_04840 [Chloroflexota bacterium]|nr:hypothetical protein [Chloroflexota bacterium]